MAGNEGLMRLIQKIEAISTAGFRYELGRAMSVDALVRVNRGFNREENPYGEPWASRKSGGDWPILDKTGRMRNSPSAMPSSSGFKLAVNTGYARFHQYPTKNQIVRMMLPSPTRGLPLSWVESFQRIYTRQVAGYLK